MEDMDTHLDTYPVTRPCYELRHCAYGFRFVRPDS
jgi:hypothetical protein